MKRLIIIMLVSIALLFIGYLYKATLYPKIGLSPTNSNSIDNELDQELENTLNDLEKQLNEVDQTLNEQQPDLE